MKIYKMSWQREIADLSLLACVGDSCYDRGERGGNMDILLVEDNQTIVKGLEYAFKNHDYPFHAVMSVRDARKYVEKQQIDLLILDITLPDGNGLRFFEEEIRKRKIPTIFLTAEDEEETIVQGLNLGAEDYITKPFSTKELLARVNRVLLRNRKESVICVNGLEFDMDKMTVSRDGERIELTSLELRILYLLFSNLNKVVSRSIILDKIWEWTGNDVDAHTVTVYLKRIREKIGNDVIVTVKGIGYRVDQNEK